MTAVADAPTEISVPASATAFQPKFTMTADLLPEEIRVGRRVAFLKRRLTFVLAALVALVVLGDALVRQQTSSAEGDLAAANKIVATLTRQSHGFGALLTTQADTQAIRAALAGALADDVSWTALLNKISAAAPAGIGFSSVTAQLMAPTSTGSVAGGSTTPVTSAQPTIGTVTLLGAAPSWAAVAAYVNALAATKGITAVNPSTVSNAGGIPGSTAHGLTFTITLSLTSAVLSERYALTPTGGSAATTANTGTTNGSASQKLAHGTTATRSATAGAPAVATRSAAAGGTPKAAHPAAAKHAAAARHSSPATYKSGKAPTTHGSQKAN